MKTKSLFYSRLIMLEGAPTGAESLERRNFPKEANKLRYDIRKLQEKEPEDEGYKKLREQLRQVANKEITGEEAAEVIADASKYLNKEKEKQAVKTEKAEERKQVLYGMELTGPRKATGEAGGFEVEFDTGKRSIQEIAEKINIPKIRERMMDINLKIGLKFESARNVIYSIAKVDSEQNLNEKAQKSDSVKNLKKAYDDFYSLTIDASEKMLDKIYAVVLDPDFESKANAIIDEAIKEVKEGVKKLSSAIDTYIDEVEAKNERGRELAKDTMGKDWDEFIAGFDGKPIIEKEQKYVENTVYLDEPAGVRKLEIEQEQAQAESEKAISERIKGLNAKIPEKFSSWVWFEKPVKEPDVALLAYKADPVRFFHLNRLNLKNIEASVDPENKNVLVVQIDDDTNLKFDISDAKKGDVKVTRFNSYSGNKVAVGDTMKDSEETTVAQVSE